jgi:rubredoxin
VAIVTEEMQADPSTAVYECTNCGTVYVPSRGDPDGGIAPGTRFVDLPDGWQCPVCGAQKSEFRKMEVGESFDEAAA